MDDQTPIKVKRGESNSAASEWLYVPIFPMRFYQWFKGKNTGQSHGLHGKIDGFQLRFSLTSTH